jgi:hypothetical protein
VFADAARYLAEIAELQAKERELSTESEAYDNGSLGKASDMQSPSGSSLVGLEELQAGWSELSRVAEVTSHDLSADVSHWNIYESACSKLVDLLEKAEKYADNDDKLPEVLGKSSSLDKARQQKNEHQHFVSDLAYFEPVLRELISEAQYLLDKPYVAEEVKTIEGRWNAVMAKLGSQAETLENAVETWTRYVDHVELVRRQISTIMSRKLSVGNPDTKTTNVDSLQNQLKVYKVCILLRSSCK